MKTSALVPQSQFQRRLSCRSAVGPEAPSSSEVTPPDALATIADDFGVQLAADQETFFASNTFSPLNGKLCRLVSFKRHRATTYNTFVWLLTMLQKPRFRFGPFDYRERILGMNYQYAILGFVDESQRLIWWHPSDSGNQTYCITSDHQAPTDGMPTPGSLWSWTVDGGTGTSKYLGSFTATVTVLPDDDDQEE